MYHVYWPSSLRPMTLYHFGTVLVFCSPYFVNTLEVWVIVKYGGFECSELTSVDYLWKFEAFLKMQVNTFRPFGLSEPQAGGGGATLKFVTHMGTTEFGQKMTHPPLIPGYYPRAIYKIWTKIGHPPLFDRFFV